MIWDTSLKASLPERARDLLEDFEVIATKLYIVLVPRDPSSQTLNDNIHAAIVAYTLGLSSIDYAKRTYCSSDRGNEDDLQGVKLLHAYIAAYRAAKAYIHRMRKKVEPEGLPDPELGVFGSSVVLERLTPSFFSAHFLYRLGHRYEGHAVSRLILEQVAWAYAAHTLRDIRDIKHIKTTKAVSELARFIPEVGRLYGFLNEKTHIDYGSHAEFLTIEKGRNIILHGQPEFLEYAEVILRLADVFGVVWEVSQWNYVKTPETIRAGPSGLLIRQDRPFLETMNSHLSEIKSALSQPDVPKPRSPQQRNPPFKGTRRRRRAP